MCPKGKNTRSTESVHTMCPKVKMRTRTESEDWPEDWPRDALLVVLSGIRSFPWKAQSKLGEKRIRIPPHAPLEGAWGGIRIAGGKKGIITQIYHRDFFQFFL